MALPKKRRSSERLQKVIESAVKDVDLKAIFKRLVDDAKEGDKKSSELILAYTFGRPISIVEKQVLENKKKDSDYILDEAQDVPYEMLEEAVYKKNEDS